MKIFFFYAPLWCDSSRRMEQEWDKAAKSFKNERIDKVNVETEKGVNLSIRHTVRNVPTIIAVDDNGYEKSRMKGYQDADSIINFINNNL